MAENFQNLKQGESNTFIKGMMKDLNDSFLPEGAWSHARNATVNTLQGDTATISNESSTLLCASAPYPVIGYIFFNDDEWVIFSTDDNNNHEIGIYTESTCTYTKVVNDPCLNFSSSHPIRSGGVKLSFDCHRYFYWDDGLNPTRYLSPTRIPYIQICTNSPTGCTTCVDTTALDCDQIKLTPKIKIPKVDIRKATYGGELINGSYQACVAYTINQQRFGDYYAITNPQPIFNHVGIGGAVEVSVSNLDTEYFSEFELVIVYTISGNTIAKSFGFYATSNGSGPSIEATIGISIIPDSLLTVPLSNLPVRRPVYERSDATYTVGDYMLRVGPRTRYSFNYQPEANKIKSKYVIWQVESSFYKIGGAVTGYMSDEVYPFFIRFLYDTGERSDSYHIPGRAPVQSDLGIISPGNGNNFDIAFNWEGEDTSSVTSNPNTLYTDTASKYEGLIIEEGDMSYWQSSERYPNDPVRYDTLCNQYIRHHKFPSRRTGNSWHHSNDGRNIRIMGVRFYNIAKPQMPDPNNPSVLIDVPNIVGYEILRGSREGNKTIVAKGIFNNLLVEATGTSLDAIQNFPYNQCGGNEVLLQTANTAYGRGNCDGAGNPNMPKANFQRAQHYSFHSPDTQFKEPYLAPYEAKKYGIVNGELDRAIFSPVENHPRHKLPSDLSFFLSMIAGLILGVKKASSEPTISTITLPKTKGPETLSGSTLPTGILTAAQASELSLFFIDILANNTLNTLTPEIARMLANFTLNINTSSVKYVQPTTTLAAASTTSGTYRDFINRIFGQTVLGNSAFELPTTTLTFNDSPYEGMPLLLKAFYQLPIILNSWSEATDEFLELLLKLVPYRQFAYQQRSHCLYTTSSNLRISRRKVLNSGYIGSGVFNAGNVRIDNTLRNKFVFIETQSLSLDHTGLVDNSRFTLGGANIPYGKDYINGLPVTGKISSTIYGALVNRIVNQYGQLDTINQIPISSHYIDSPNSNNTWVASTGPLFGGDIYIGRHTEKNPFFFFRSWLQNRPDGYEIDYRKYSATVFRPRFWMNTESYDLNDFLKGLASGLGSLVSSVFFDPTSSSGPTQLPLQPDQDGIVPSDFSNLDQDPANCGVTSVRLGVKNAFMYLFYSGVRDFFVESEINVDLRDWLDEDRYRHYQPYEYTDLDKLFNPDVITEREPYRYDFSLSHSKIFFDKISWGNIQPRTYDPITYLDCFTYDPSMVVYSLPDNGSVSDPWRVYLPDNFKILSGTIVNIKNINKNGSMIVFDDRSPVMIQGSDSLQTDLGTKVTLGDGGLFEQAMQNISSSDRSFMEGACIDTFGVINCPAGVFLMSNSLRKIYRVAGQGALEDITAKGLKWWFNNYMGYKILEDFPSFPDTNNLAVGIGSFITYDHESSILYFTKRDYIINPALKNTWDYVYTGKGRFTLFSKVVPGLKLRGIKLDSKYFVNVSWTISYDPKQEFWVSFHDWHPNYTLSSRTKFTAINGKDFWKHNVRFDNFCNFYGTDYPFEIEVPINTKQVSIVDSFEYYLDAVVYTDSPDVSYTQLDGNFDQAVVSNREQCSGLLNLVPYPRDFPYTASLFPTTVGNSINILVSKEENKYRFNQFYDIVNNRNAATPIWVIGKDGYKKQLNPAAINYTKPEFQQKRLRNYFQKVFLRKTISGAVNFVFKIFNTKSTISPR
jgi:hypothetical protein